MGQFVFVDILCGILKYYLDEVTFQGNYSLQEPESGKFKKKKKKLEAVQCFMHVNSWKQLVMEF